MGGALALDRDNSKFKYAMGTVAMRSRDVSSAIPYFETYISAQPQDPRGHFAVGAACFAAGDDDRARKEMEGLRTTATTAAGAEYFLGRIARLDEKLAAAANDIQKSIHLLPSFAESY